MVNGQKIYSKLGKKNTNADGDSFLDKTLGKPLIGDPTAKLARSLVRINQANLKLVTAYITEHGHLGTIWQLLVDI